MKYSKQSLAQVKNLATKLAKTMRWQGGVIGLSGQLGAGKTTFTKAFAQALGVRSVKSPTFIVSQRYNLKDRFLYHLDFYRLEDSQQLSPLGLEEILLPPNIVLIEWVEKFPQIAKKCDILINLQVLPNNKRNVTIKSN